MWLLLLIVLGYIFLGWAITRKDILDDTTDDVWNFLVHDLWNYTFAHSKRPRSGQL